MTVRTELQKLTIQVANAAAEYESAAASQAQHDLVHLQHQPGGKPTGKPAKPAGINGPLINSYSSRMVPERSPGRSFYDQLLAGAPDGRCTLCGHGLAATLDHQLPKTLYPLLAVAPLNLVPACRDCNSNKRELAPASAEEQTLHPYFDSDTQQYTWLTAHITGAPEPSVTFQATPPPDMPPLLAARARHHFAVLRLGLLYAPQAGPEMRVLSGMLIRLPRSELRSYLRERAEVWAAENPNCWQAALYRALADSDWYIEHGHREPWGP
ncbi:HNH endonuclease [Kitasatospora sp. NPDC001132]